LSGWKYRKSHVINPASGAGTNYQIKVTVHYGAGSDSGEDVYLDGKCRTDFGDVRFTDDDGVTLDYWMEEKVDSDYAIFWVEVADDLSTTAQTIYIYYGKSDATTTSNGTNTFPDLFDDFEDGVIDTNIWTKAVDNATYADVYETGGHLVLHKKAISSSPWRDARVYTAAKSVNKALRYRYMRNIISGGGENTRSIMGFSNHHVPASITEGVYWYNGQWSGYNYGNRIVYRAENDDNLLSASYDTDAPDEEWMVLESRWATDKAQHLKNDANRLTTTDAMYIPDISLPVYFSVGCGADNKEVKHHIDWVFIRKYVDPEPSHGVWGSEETPPSSGSIVPLMECLGMLLTKRKTKLPSWSKRFPELNPLKTNFQA